MPLKLKRWKNRGSTWYVRGTVFGQRVFESTETDKKTDAEKYRLKRERELYERGAFGTKEVLTFAEAANSYMDRGGEQIHLHRIIEKLGTMKMALIDQTIADRYANMLYGGRSPGTLIRQFYTPLLAVINDAWRAGLCDKPRIRRPKYDPKRVRPASQADIDKLLPHCSKELAAIITFMTYTSARISEAVNLQWQDVDLERGYAVLQNTKNKDPAMPALHSRVVTALANLDTDVGRVFGFRNHYAVYHVLKVACKKAGVDYKSVTPHKAGRHRFAARLLEEGHSLQIVKEAGYWKTIKVVSDNYGHLEQKQVHDIVRGVGKKKV